MSAIVVENLSKKYRLHPKDSIRDFFRKKDLKESEFWALKEITFSVEKGEKVGFIGKNGAGKSTLLKVLSSITHPTSGSYKIFGRIVSLLEVGTGFHPELSGRENIFLYGAILGMSKKEILKSFDAIVSFAEINKFLDLPVKRYSSGMYARLGFAVAIHVNPDILIVDEVFSVGDVAFQKKCVQKLQELENVGVTLLFVGHNLSQLKSICSRGILLEAGKIVFDGPVDTCAKLYLGQHNSLASDAIQLIKVDLQKDLELEFTNFGNGTLTVEVESSDRVIASTNLQMIYPDQKIPLGHQKAKLSLDSLFLPGDYLISIHINDKRAMALDYSVQGNEKAQGLSLDHFWGRS